MARTENANKLSVSAGRRQRERAEMRQRIMDAAREQFARQGYEAVTLRGIARAIEYSPALIYQYFKDKNSLIIEICLEDYSALTRVLADCRGIKDPVERLCSMARAYAQWGVTHPNHYQMLMVHLLRYGTIEIGEAGYVKVLPPEEDAFCYLRSCVEEGRSAGFFRAEYCDTDLIATTMWSALHGVVSLEINMNAQRLDSLGDHPYPFSARLNALLDVLVEGYIRRGAERRPGENSAK